MIRWSESLPVTTDKRRGTSRMTTINHRRRNFHFILQTPVRAKPEAVKLILRDWTVAYISQSGTVASWCRPWDFKI